MKKISILLITLFSVLAYSQEENKLFEVYENNQERNVRLEAVREGDKIIFRKTTEGDIVSEDGTIEEEEKDNLPSVPQFYKSIVKRNYLELEQMLKDGANVNNTLYEKNTALHLAASWNDNQMVDILLKNKANIKAINNKGETPLHFACGYGNTQLLLKMETKKFNEELNKKTKNGWTCLHFLALYSKNINSAKYIASFNPNFNIKDENEQTPAHFAAASRNFPILLEWVKLGLINLQEKDKHLNTVEDYVIKNSDIFMQMQFFPYLSENKKQFLKENIDLFK